MDQSASVNSDVSSEHSENSAVWSDEENEEELANNFEESVVPSNTLLIKQQDEELSEDHIKETLAQFAMIDMQVSVSLQIYDTNVVTRWQSNPCVYKVVFRDEEDAENALEHAKQSFGDQSVVYPYYNTCVCLFVDVDDMESTSLSSIIRNHTKWLSLFSSAVADSLLVPKNRHHVLTSPPPSPPSGWKPLREDINTIPYLDLNPVKVGNEEILLSGDNGLPSIVVTPF